MLDKVYHASRDKLVRFLMLQTGSLADAEDVAQAAYVKLFVKADTLAPSNLRALLFLTARNLALDLRRQRGRRDRVIRDLDDGSNPIGQVASPYPDAERSLIARENFETLAGLIAELSPKCRQAFVAYKFEERGYREIAAEIGVSESMVRKYVIRAVSHLARRFEEMEGWA